ncbi:MAG: glycosyltransferase family protein [Anaerolineales bacterium]|nr:glycosyltransferase family protein [Anaerolineales bacterium]
MSSKPKVVAIIQARMAASRLPGKVLKELGHLSVLGWMIARARRAELIDEVVIATTTDSSDDPVAAYCEQNGVKFTRGSMQDVLDRYYRAAKLHGADVVVRLTADCPFIDPAMLDDNLRTFMGAEPKLDFAANRLPPPYKRTIPIGLDAEFCWFEGLETIWHEAKEKHQREHVMPYFYEHPERFNVLHIIHQPSYGHLRWTVDTPEDLALLRQIVNHFPGRDDFSWKDVLALVEAHPELGEINADVRHKDYREVDERQ